MRIKIFVLIILFALCITGCKTSPPLVYEETIEYGKVYVSSNIDSAKIFLDNSFTGKYTPDTITASVGGHIIKLEKENYAAQTFMVTVNKESVQIVVLTLQQVSASKVVLLEDFANVSCTPCVTSNQIIEQLVHTTYGVNKLVAVKFPTNFPSPNDPFFNANMQDANSRINYYKVLSAPSIFIDGIEKPSATDSISIKEKIDTRIAQAPVFGLEVNKNISGAALDVEVIVTPIDASINTANFVLHVVVIESKIEFASPPGSNGEKIFYNVMRRMLPNNAGTSIASINLMAANNFNFQAVLNSAWQSSEINVVVFIQNVQTKEVLQAAATVQ
jgi:hypothetical protein